MSRSGYGLIHMISTPLTNMNMEKIMEFLQLFGRKLDAYQGRSEEETKANTNDDQK
jgi:hypothetical protein